MIIRQVLHHVLAVEYIKYNIRSLLNVHLADLFEHISLRAFVDSLPCSFVSSSDGSGLPIVCSENGLGATVTSPLTLVLVWSPKRASKADPTYIQGLHPACPLLCSRSPHHLLILYSEIHIAATSSLLYHCICDVHITIWNMLMRINLIYGD